MSQRSSSRWLVWAFLLLLICGDQGVQAIQGTVLRSRVDRHAIEEAEAADAVVRNAEAALRAAEEVLAEAGAQHRSSMPNKSVAVTSLGQQHEEDFAPLTARFAEAQATAEAGVGVGPLTAIFITTVVLSLINVILGKVRTAVLKSAAKAKKANARGLEELYRRSLKQQQAFSDVLGTLISDANRRLESAVIDLALDVLDPRQAKGQAVIGTVDLLAMGCRLTKGKDPTDPLLNDDLRAAVIRLETVCDNNGVLMNPAGMVNNPRADENALFVQKVLYKALRSEEVRDFRDLEVEALTYQAHGMLKPWELDEHGKAIQKHMKATSKLKRLEAKRQKLEMEIAQKKTGRPSLWQKTKRWWSNRKLAAANAKVDAAAPGVQAVFDKADERRAAFAKASNNRIDVREALGAVSPNLGSLATIFAVGADLVAPPGASVADEISDRIPHKALIIPGDTEAAKRKWLGLGKLKMPTLHRLPVKSSRRSSGSGSLIEGSSASEALEEMDDKDDPQAKFLAHVGALAALAQANTVQLLGNSAVNTGAGGVGTASNDAVNTRSKDAVTKMITAASQSAGQDDTDLALQAMANTNTGKVFASHAAALYFLPTTAEAAGQKHKHAFTNPTIGFYRAPVVELASILLTAVTIENDRNKHSMSEFKAARDSGLLWQATEDQRPFAAVNLCRSVVSLRRTLHMVLETTSKLVDQEGAAAVPESVADGILGLLGFGGLHLRPDVKAKMAKTFLLSLCSAFQPVYERAGGLFDRSKGFCITSPDVAPIVEYDNQLWSEAKRFLKDNYPQSMLNDIINNNKQRSQSIVGSGRTVSPSKSVGGVFEPFDTSNNNNHRQQQDRRLSAGDASQSQRSGGSLSGGSGVRGGGGATSSVGSHGFDNNNYHHQGDRSDSLKTVAGGSSAGGNSFRFPSTEAQAEAEVDPPAGVVARDRDRDRSSSLAMSEERKSEGSSSHNEEMAILGGFKNKPTSESDRKARPGFYQPDRNIVSGGSSSNGGFPLAVIDDDRLHGSSGQRSNSGASSDTNDAARAVSLLATSTASSAKSRKASLILPELEHLLAVAVENKQDTTAAAKALSVAKEVAFGGTANRGICVPHPGSVSALDFYDIQLTTKADLPKWVEVGYRPLGMPSEFTSGIKATTDSKPYLQDGDMSVRFRANDRLIADIKNVMSRSRQDYTRVKVLPANNVNNTRILVGLQCKDLPDINDPRHGRSFFLDPKVVEARRGKEGLMAHLATLQRPISDIVFFQRAEGGDKRANWAQDHAKIIESLKEYGSKRKKPLLPSESEIQLLSAGFQEIRMVPPKELDKFFAGTDQFVIPRRLGEPVLTRANTVLAATNTDRVDEDDKNPTSIFIFLLRGGATTIQDLQLLPYYSPPVETSDTMWRRLSETPIVKASDAWTAKLQAARLLHYVQQAPKKKGKLAKLWAKIKRSPVTDPDPDLAVLEYKDFDDGDAFDAVSQYWPHKSLQRGSYLFSPLGCTLYDEAIPPRQLARSPAELGSSKPVDVDVLSSKVLHGFESYCPDLPVNHRWVRVAGVSPFEDLWQTKSKTSAVVMPAFWARRRLLTIGFEEETFRTTPACPDACQLASKGVIFAKGRWDDPDRQAQAMQQAEEVEEENSSEDPAEDRSARSTSTVLRRLSEGIAGSSKDGKVSNNGSNGSK